MIRLTPIDPAKATGRTKALLDTVQVALGRTPNVIRVMALSSAVLEGYLAFSKALAQGSLNPRLRERIALTAAEINRCQYCLSAHAAIGKMVGLSEAEIATSREQASADFKTAAALGLVSAILARRGDVTDDELRRARRAGYSDSEIAEIVANVALNVFTNYLNVLADTELDFPPVALSRPGRAGDPASAAPQSHSENGAI